MRVEPRYGLPVEEPGDVEGWSVNADQGGAVLAEAIAAQLARIEGDHDALLDQVTNLPSTIQTGFVALPVEVFRDVSTSFYNSDYIRGFEAIVFDQPFDAAPSVVMIPNNTAEPGFPIEATVTDVTPSGFTAVLGVSVEFTGTFISRWIAAERTQ